MPEANKLCRVVFSKRGGLKYEDFQSYLRTLQADPSHGSNANWQFVGPEGVVDEPHSDWNAAHLAADYLAASFGSALNRKDQDVFDPRFARLWCDRVYSYRKKHVGNGFKVWPDQGLDALRQDPIGDLVKVAFNWK